MSVEETEKPLKMGYTKPSALEKEAWSASNTMKIKALYMYLFIFRILQKYKKKCNVVIVPRPPKFFVPLQDY